MQLHQIDITLEPYSRGFHLITHHINNALHQLGKIQSGLCHIFIRHTSASLTINENADYDVRSDFEVFFNHLVPESFPKFRHTSEGSDDMPAHLKSSILGPSVLIPVKNGKLHLGTWQGVYLCEHRDYGGSRRITITILGDA